MFLIENPVLRDACFPSVRPAYWVEPATPRDRAAVFDIVARHESPTAAAVLGRWWERHGATFSVARGADGAVAAFVQIAAATRLARLRPGERRRLAGRAHRRRDDGDHRARRRARFGDRPARASRPSKGSPSCRYYSDRVSRPA